MTTADRALEFVEEGTTIGLGTGRAATSFVEALGRKVGEGFRIRGVPTSASTADLARQLGIPLATLDQVESLAATFDGADEVAPGLDLIKGYGGALVREKIVAASSKKLIILVGPGKVVPILGARGKLPIEVVPFGLPLVLQRLAKLGLKAEVRPVEAEATTLADQGFGLHRPTGNADPSNRDAAEPFRTDNGNLILDCEVGPIDDPAAFEQSILAIPGVVDTGLFLGMASAVIVEDESGNVTVKRRD